MIGGRQLAAGAFLVAAILALAALAPIVASDKPVLVVAGEGRPFFPALADAPLPAAWRHGLAGREGQWRSPPGGTRFALPAPVPHSPTRIDLDAIRRPPGRSHWLGTDGLGRDVAARMIHGATVSLTVGVAAVAVAVGIGLLLGALAGYFGGVVDATLSRLLEVFFCFPALILILALLGIPGSTGMAPIVVAIGVTRWTGTARLVRGEFLSLRERDFVRSARAAGASDLRILCRHILPHSLPPVLVTAAFGVSGAVLLESALSFLGFGIQPPTPSWGNILSEARLGLNAWWLALWPTIGIFLTVLAFNLVGDGLRDRIDPKESRRPRAG